MRSNNSTSLPAGEESLAHLLQAKQDFAAGCELGKLAASVDISFFNQIHDGSDVSVNLDKVFGYLSFTSESERDHLLSNNYNYLLMLLDEKYIISNDQGLCLMQPDERYQQHFYGVATVNESIENLPGNDLAIEPILNPDFIDGDSLQSDIEQDQNNHNSPSPEKVNQPLLSSTPYIAIMMSLADCFKQAIWLEQGKTSLVTPRIPGLIFNNVVNRNPQYLDTFELISKQLALKKVEILKDKANFTFASCRNTVEKIPDSYLSKEKKDEYLELLDFSVGTNDTTILTHDVFKEMHKSLQTRSINELRGVFFRKRKKINELFLSSLEPRVDFPIINNNDFFLLEENTSFKIVIPERHRDYLNKACPKLAANVTTPNAAATEQTAIHPIEKNSPYEGLMKGIAKCFSSILDHKNITKTQLFISGHLVSALSLNGNKSMMAKVALKSISIQLGIIKIAPKSMRPHLVFKDTELALKQIPTRYLPNAIKDKLRKLFNDALASKKGNLTSKIGKESKSTHSSLLQLMPPIANQEIASTTTTTTSYLRDAMPVTEVPIPKAPASTESNLVYSADTNFSMMLWNGDEMDDEFNQNPESAVDNIFGSYNRAW